MKKRTPYALLEPKPRPLQDVARRAARFDEARFALYDAIVAAYAQGFTFRTIAEASGIYSHEHVRRIVRQRSGGGRTGT